MRKLLRLGKFFLVGAIGMPVHLGVLYGLTEAGLYYIASASIAVIIAISFNYFLNHYWTFRDRHTSSIGKGYIKYMLLGAISDATYLGLLYVAVDMLHIYYVLAAGGIIVMLGLLRYHIIGRWIWRTKEKSSQSQAPRCPTEMRSTSPHQAEKTVKPCV